MNESSDVSDVCDVWAREGLGGCSCSGIEQRSNVPAVVLSYREHD